MSIASLILIALGAGAAAFALSWLVASRKTERRFLTPPAPVRAWRRWRWFWFRIGMNAFSWPHVVDVMLGTKDAPVAQTPSRVVWEEGSASLRRYGRGGGAAVLVVHSLVSQPWILDLVPGRSLIEFLVSEGFDVFLLDWGDPTHGTAHGLTGCSDILMKAEREVSNVTGAQKVHLVGYCLGGLVCLARTAARRHANVASITLLATPVDFGIRVALQPLIVNPLFKPVYFLDDRGCVPATALRESFHVLRPQALRTVIAAWRRRKDAQFRRSYDPLSRWVWEHRALSGEMFFDLVELFRHNSLFKGTLTVSGELARLTDIQAPVLALIAERDHIVPSASSRALADVPGLDVTVVELNSGHVSMVSGGAAKTTTWPAIASWIRSDRCGEPQV